MEVILHYSPNYVFHVSEHYTLQQQHELQLLLNCSTLFLNKLLCML